MQRPFQIVVPFKLKDAKSRLATVLTPSERQLLAFAMLRDVLDAVLGQSHVTVLSRPGLDNAEVRRDVEIQESVLELNEALNAFIEVHASKGWPSDLLIIMADLALLTEKDVLGILNCRGDLVLSPGRGGGTNMILIRSQKFRTCYTGLSYPKHLGLAADLELDVSIFESFRAGCDIDEPEDLAEVLLHGHGEANAFLKDKGFVLLENGRKCVGRKG